MMKKLTTTIIYIALAVGGLTTVADTQVSSSGASDIILLGDVDKDNKITLRDAQKVLRFSVRIENPTPEQKIYVDVNGDGHIDLRDAQMTLKIAVGIEAEQIIEIVVTAEPTATPEPKLKAETSIPVTYRNENTEASGSVITINYKTHDYFGDGHEIAKSAYVYLPYGYDETKQYNVVYAMHGVGGTSNEWEIAKNNSLLKKYFDNMVANGDMQPTIFVFPTGRSCANYNDTSGGGMNSNMQAFYLFGKELRNDLIPYVDENFATYADYKQGYDMTLAREHRGMVGFSMGGMQTTNIGLCECLDIISCFGAFSSAPTTCNAETINATINSRFAQYDIGLFYNVCGSSDSIALSSHEAAMNGLVEGSGGRFVEGENYLWHQVPGGHTMGVWQLGIYNFARLAFRNNR